MTSADAAAESGHCIELAAAAALVAAAAALAAAAVGCCIGLAAAAAADAGSGGIEDRVGHAAADAASAAEQEGAVWLCTWMPAALGRQPWLEL